MAVRKSTEPGPKTTVVMVAPVPQLSTILESLKSRAGWICIVLITSAVGLGFDINIVSVELKFGATRVGEKATVMVGGGA